MSTGKESTDDEAMPAATIYHGAPPIVPLIINPRDTSVASVLDAVDIDPLPLFIAIAITNV